MYVYSFVQTAAGLLVFKEFPLKWTKYFCGIVCCCVFFGLDHLKEMDEMMRGVQVQSNVKDYEEWETYLESNKKGRENTSGSNSLVMLSLTDEFNVLNAEITSKGCFLSLFLVSGPMENILIELFSLKSAPPFGKGS